MMGSNDRKLYFFNFSDSYDCITEIWPNIQKNIRFLYIFNSTGDDIEIYLSYVSNNF